MDESEQKEKESVAHVLMFLFELFLFVDLVWGEIFKEKEEI